MSRRPAAPDWSALKFEEGRFQVIHDLLDDYEQQSSSASQPLDRDEFLKRCQSGFERDVMIREMDYLDELRLNPIRFVGGYLVEKTVAIGGFGVVSLGFDQQGNPVAIKVPHMSWQIARDRDELDAEAMILKELEHPNIVGFIECGYDESWYLITEWVNGFNLGQAIREIRAPLTQWLDVISQVCDALSFGHQLGIVHRDINPRNIMVSGEGQPVAKVLDYGIAKRTGAESDRSGHFTGTRQYIAPEQYRGHCDERSDIYALGVTMSEVVDAQYASPGRVPRPLQKIIARATARNPAKRYATAGQMKSAIQSVSAGLSSGKIAIVNRPSRRRMAAAVLGLVALVACVLVAVPWRTGAPDQPLAGPPAPGKLAVATPAFGECFSEAGHPRILLESTPPGARLTIFTLTHGEPDPQRRIELGVAPAKSTVPPGDYLVVAEWPDGQWTEVLRRFPKYETRGVMPVSPLDAFEKQADALRFATIRQPEFSTDGMAFHEGLWVDSAPQDEPPHRLAASYFGQACRILEKQGKRLPFATELRRCFRSKKVHSSGDEWTCTLVAEDIFLNLQQGGRNVYIQFNDYVVIPGGGRGDSYPLSESPVQPVQIGFRGVRSGVPFGPRRQ